MVKEDAKVVFFKKSCRRDLVSKAIVLTLFVTSKMPIRKSPFIVWERRRRRLGQKTKPEFNISRKFWKIEIRREV